jgi:hypothetical protein
VVKLALYRLPDEGYVVRLVRARQEGTDHELFVRPRHHLLRDPETQHFAEELHGAVEVVAIQ